MVILLVYLSSEARLHDKSKPDTTES